MAKTVRLDGGGSAKVVAGETVIVTQKLHGYVQKVALSFGEIEKIYSAMRPSSDA